MEWLLVVVFGYGVGGVTNKVTEAQCRSAVAYYGGMATCFSPNGETVKWEPSKEAPTMSTKKSVDDYAAERLAREKAK